MTMNKNKIQTLVEHCAGGIVVVDDKRHVVFANRAARLLLAWSAGSDGDDRLAVSCAAGEVVDMAVAGAHKRIVELRGTAIDWGDQVATLVSVSDVTRWRHCESILATRAATQNAVSQLIADAMTGVSTPAAVRSRAVALARESLDVDIGMILELNASESAFRVAEGAGWRGDCLANYTIVVDEDRPSGRALLAAEPVTVDWRSEHRFAKPAIVHETRIRCSIYVPVLRPSDMGGKASAVLAAHNRSARSWLADDVAVLQRIASVLTYITVHSERVFRRGDEAMFKQVSERVARVGLWEVNLADDRVTWSPHVAAMYGLPEKQTVLTFDEAGRYVTGAHREPMREAMSRLLHDGTPMDEELKITTAEGREGWLRTLGKPVYDAHGRIVSARGATQDITRYRHAQQEIEFLAYHDPLTKLPNRRLLEKRLQAAIEFNRKNGRKAALMFLDLDNFKTLNDTLGHGQGDKLLVQVTQRLIEIQRNGDTVGRFGGDEFVIIVTNLAADGDRAAVQALHAAERLLARLRQPYWLEDFEHVSTQSIGVTLFGFANDDTNELFKQADLTLYEAKKRGRDRVCVYDPVLQKKVKVRAALLDDLRHGLKNDELQAYYQAQVDSRGQVVGAEVLARWQHPVRGMISPADFIPLIESTRMIHELGAVMLTIACEQLALWAKRGCYPQLHLSVNVSARQFIHPAFVATVRQIITDTGADPRRLVLELTETLLLDNISNAGAKMTELTRLGVRFSLDDFGTGYSSLYYLHTLPLKQIKIDQRFVREVDRADADGAIIRAAVSLANATRMGVVAEGVETIEQRDFLEAHGCYVYQGFLFHRPQPIEKLETFLATGCPEN